MTWTHFMDMHSGGRCKIKENGIDIEQIYIEAGRKAAEKFFHQLFGRDPDNVTCDCCGSDYSVSEHSSLEKASGFYRNCKTIKPIAKDDDYQNPAYKTAAYIEHYYLEEGETPPEGYVVDSKMYSSSMPYKPVSEYRKDPHVRVLAKRDLCKAIAKMIEE